jgi:hypothetical protein
VDPTQSQELRALPSGRNLIKSGADLEGLLAWAESCGDEVVYWGINPINRGHTAPTAKKHDVASRRWLFIDIDPIKPEENKDDSATDEEHENARVLAYDVQVYLGEREWPAPIVIDSGNGWYLLYRIDLPNTPHAQAILKKVYYHLNERFDGGGIIDKSVHNANRLAKLPGGMARKGAPTPERPHRMCKIVHVPAHLEIVPAEMLSALTAGEDAIIREENIPHLFRLDGTPAGHAKYVQRAMEGEIARVALALRGAAGGLNNALNDAAFRLGTLGGAGVLAESDAYAALVQLAVSRGLGEREAEATFKSGWNSGSDHPRTLPEPRKGPPMAKLGPGAKGAASKGVVPEGKVIVRASEVKVRKVEWLWPARIPLGKLTTFAGNGGLGKTFVLCDITARITQGGFWPDTPDGPPTTPGQVLFISGEDDPEDTLVPRLIEVGANLERVAFLGQAALDTFKLANLDLLNSAVDQIGEAVRLVVIDPPTAYLDGVDDHKNGDLRGLLTPLAAFAAQRRLSVVFNTHVNKAQGTKVEALARVMGSVAWVNAVRAGHMFAKDPDDDTKRIFVPMKSNLGPPKKGLAYRLVASGDELARVEWLGEVDTTADQAANAEKGKGRKVVAKDWLIDAFRAKRVWSSKELFEAAKHEGVSQSAIYEAKAILCLPKARKMTHENGDTEWMWWVPDNWPPLAEPAEPTADAPEVF